MGIKVPSIVEEAKKALESGYCVVIGLQTTGEVRLIIIICSGFLNRKMVPQLTGDVS